MKEIQIFNKIRDTPYHCPESKNDLEITCRGKSRMLYDYLKKARYQVRFRVCDFYWCEQKIPEHSLQRPLLIWTNIYF